MVEYMFYFVKKIRRVLIFRSSLFAIKTPLPLSKQVKHSEGFISFTFIAIFFKGLLDAGVQLRGREPALKCVRQPFDFPCVAGHLADGAPPSVTADQPGNVKI
jgi:hypothetical protein